MFTRLKRTLLGERFDPFAAHGFPPVPNCEYLSWDVIAFVRAMTLRYGDRLPQLVFADYLDDHGEPEWAARLCEGVVYERSYARTQRVVASDVPRPEAAWLWERSITQDVPRYGIVRVSAICALTPPSLALLDAEGRLMLTEARRAREWAAGDTNSFFYRRDLGLRSIV